MVPWVGEALGAPLSSGHTHPPKCREESSRLLRAPFSKDGHQQGLVQTLWNIQVNHGSTASGLRDLPLCLAVVVAVAVVVLTLQLVS